MHAAGLADTVVCDLKNSGLPPRGSCVEVTESVPAEECHAAPKLAALSYAGIAGCRPA